MSDHTNQTLGKLAEILADSLENASYKEEMVNILQKAETEVECCSFTWEGFLKGFEDKAFYIVMDSELPKVIGRLYLENYDEATLNRARKLYQKMHNIIVMGYNERK